MQADTPTCLFKRIVRIIGWLLHLEDGTGEMNSDDLVFTIEAPLTIKPGDIVTAVGTVETDKDFGYSYFYPVLVEQSIFTVDKP
jgi:predicted NAD/FAD-dependent oxidoreductase